MKFCVRLSSRVVLGLLTWFEAKPGSTGDLGKLIDLPRSTKTEASSETCNRNLPESHYYRLFLLPLLTGFFCLEASRYTATTQPSFTRKRPDQVGEVAEGALVLSELGKLRKKRGKSRCV